MKNGIYRMSEGRFFFHILLLITCIVFIAFVGLVASEVSSTDGNNKLECQGTTSVYQTYTNDNRDIYITLNDPACTNTTGYNIPPFSGTDR